MKTIYTALFAAALLLCVQISLLAQAQQATSPLTPHPPVHPAVQQDPGERAFKANCARCHNAPEQLSPRVSPAVVMHMRVRANLSAKDSQLILRYLAP